MRHSSMISVLLSFSVVLGAPCAVYSQPAPAPAPAGSTDQADTLFRQGNALYKQQKYAEAKAAFEQAFHLKKAHDIAANLAYAEMKLNLFRDAAEHLSLAVRIWPPTGKDDKRQYAVERLDLVKKEVAMVTVQVNVPRAEVFVDGKSVGVAPLEGEVFVEAGARTIEAKAAGYADAKQVIEAAKGSAQTVTLALAPSTPVASVTAASSAAAAPTASGSAAPAKGPPDGQRPPIGPSGPSVPLIVGGAALGAGAIATGIGLGIAAQGKGKDADAILEQVHASGTPCTNPPLAGRCEDLHSARRQHDGFYKAFVGLVVSGAVVGAATVGYALWPRPKAVAAKQKQSTSVRVVPMVGPAAGGALVSGPF
jgi:hypothetical protein